MSTQITVEDDGSIRIRQNPRPPVQVVMSGGGGFGSAGASSTVGFGTGGGKPGADRGAVIRGEGAEPKLIPRAAQDGARIALRGVLSSLDGWINGEVANREAGVTGSDPDRFPPDDVRRMVADAARELGLTDLAQTIEQETNGS